MIIFYLYTYFKYINKFLNGLKIFLQFSKTETIFGTSGSFSVFNLQIKGKKQKISKKSKLCEKMPNSLFEEVIHVEKRKVYRSEEFGTTGESSIGLNAPKWSVKGVFKKFTIKSRLWDGRHIVQGIKITMADGKEHSYGMDIADKKNTIELEIPHGQYIKNLFLRAGW